MNLARGLVRVCCGSKSKTAITAAICAGALMFAGGLACQPAPLESSAGGGADGAAQDHPELVELFSWWAAPGESDALQALIAAHAEHHPEVRIFNSAVASHNKGRDQLEDRLRSEDPPDVFQEYIHASRVNTLSALRRLPLDDLVDGLGLRSVVFPEILRDATRDGHVVVMPLDVHRENTLLYNRRLFARYNLAVPTNLDELLVACRRFKEAGVVPIATSDQGWILRIMFNSLAVAKLGAASYRDYFSGRRPFDAAALRGAIDVFAEVHDKYMNPDAGDDGFLWFNAAQAVLYGDAAMFFHGDWAKGYIAALGGSGETDFGVVSAPGTSDMFLYGVDGFALANGAHNESAARQFLATVASPEGQVAFNRWKGSTPIRPDVPRQELDDIGRRTLTDFEHAQVRMMVHPRPEWEQGLQAFAHDHDRARLLRTFLAAPPGG